MKTRIYTLLVALMSVVAFTACDDWTPGDDNGYPANSGGVSTANMKVSVNETEASVSRSGVDTSGFLVTVSDKETGEIAVYDGKQCSWTYGQMPSVFTLPVGQYTVNVRSHNPESAAWSAPYYVGSADFEVSNNKVTYIGNVTCNFASIKVEVRFSKDFVEKMDPSSYVEVYAGAVGNSLTWNGSETRYGYFLPTGDDNCTVAATFSGKIKDMEITESKVVTDAKIGNYYIFSFSLQAGNPDIPLEEGQVTNNPDPNAGIVIDYDVIESNVDTTLTPGLDPVDGSDHPDKEEWPDDNTEPENPDTPDEPDDSPISITGFDYKNVIEAKEGTYELNITTKAPMTNIEVEIISPYLTTEFLNSVNLTSKFDLADPENALVDPEDPSKGTMDLTEALTRFGFSIKDQVIGQLEVKFDLSNFIPLLNLDDEPNQIHTFRLTVKSNDGESRTEDLKFMNVPEE